ncbi:hypothetical protein ACFE04_025151 [Oxalis oulophora]
MRISGGNTINPCSIFKFPAILISWSLAQIDKNKMAGQRMTLSVICLTLLLGSTAGCRFPEIYNFGDSNSDTGSVSAALVPVVAPYGVTYPGKPFGRNSNGRLIIDFMMEKLGLPFLHPYLDSVDPDFRYGANFAASRATIQPADGKLLDANFYVFSLSVQLTQFKLFKNRTTAKSLKIKNSAPTPEDFSQPLYTMDIGQNDLHYGLVTKTIEQVRESITNMTNNVTNSIKELYDGGGRTFWIHNTGPIGCLPYLAVLYPTHPNDTDQHGCVKSYNELAKDFNKQLKEKVYQLRTQLYDAKLILVDIYSAKYSLISEAKLHGFVSNLGYCCGDLEVVFCSDTAIVNGTTVFGSACKDPSKYISWDGIHYTEAANRWIADRIIDGSLSDPEISLGELCM